MAIDNNTEKEAFKGGMSDEALLSQIKLWEDESEDFYSGIKRRWDANIEYYKGNQTDLHLIAGKESKAVENRIFMATETMIPIATARLPEIEAMSLDNNEKAQMIASEHQDVLKYQMERLGMQELGEQFIRDMIVKLYGVFKVKWDKEIDDVGLERIDPKRIRIPKHGMCVYELKYLIEEMELTYDSLVEFFGKSKADELLKTRPVTSSQQKRKSTFLVHEVWTNEFVVWKSGNLILDKKDNPYYDFENEGKNYFERPEKPYIIKSLFQTEESLIGDTDYISQVRSIQDNINIRKRQLENLTDKVANPILAIDSDTMSEEEVNLITNEPGFILWGKDAANESKIRFHSPGNVPAYLFNDLEFSRNEFDNIWGMHSTTRGEREGRETLGGRKLLRAADLGRIDGVARQFERAMDEVAGWFTQLIKLFYNDKRAFVISGEDGVRYIRGFQGSELGGLRLIIRPGSTLPRDEVTIHDEAIQLWQLGAIGIETFYKMIRLPNIREALEDFINTKTGAIFQAGGAAVTPGSTPNPAALNETAGAPVQPNA